MRAAEAGRRRRGKTPASEGREAGATYAAAGVNLEAADEFVDQIAPMVRRTYGPRVLPSHGAFAGLFRLDYDERLFARNYRDPVLVSCTDGVGSKLLLAIATKRFDTVGIDLVAMNVNDLLTSGAEPLFFLDYVAVHKLEPSHAAQIVSGIVDGCEQAGCALLGGETAELPGLYRPGHFDLAGFAVGVVERKRMMDRRFVQPGDEIIALPSSGVHANGFALVRKVLLEDGGLPLDSYVRSLDATLRDVLLTPTKIYVRPVLEVLRRYRGRPRITAMAHVTGGGLPGNIPRILPPDCDAVLRRGAWPVPPIFGLLAHHGVAEDELYRVFNMGVGYVLIVRKNSTAAVLRALERSGESPYLVGRVRKGSGKVVLR